MATARGALLGLVLGGIVCATAVGKGPSKVASDVAIAPKSVAALRGRGPEGLDEALRAYDALEAELKTLKQEESRLQSVSLNDGPGKQWRNTEAGARFAEVRKLVGALERRMEQAAAVVDQIGGQRSCTVSRLYWYTDLDAAKAAAAESGRPILSLRMLGKLTDEYSCANSRFFRTALYSNADISKYLRNNFVLHWQSVRPVPHVTIDFGDGRKLERTLTGNSAHYVLAANGQPLDVLPGLYSPQSFLSWLWNVSNLHERYQAANAADRSATLQAHHRSRNDAILQAWDRDIQRLAGGQTTLVSMRINSAIERARTAGQDAPAPNAGVAAEQAVTKTDGEAPLLRFAHLGGPWMERGMDDDVWQAIADLHRKEVKLDEPSVALMRREFPPAADAGRLSMSKSIQEDPVLRMVRVFENSMTLDTVRNEYLLHRRIHEKFVEGNAATTNVDALNEWVYAELFLTPSSDPWLGLAPRDVYTALEGDGRTEPALEVARGTR